MSAKNIDALRKRLAKIEGLKTGAQLLEEQTERQKEYDPSALPGHEVENDFGVYWLAESRMPVTEPHGDEPVGALLAAPTAWIAQVARVSAERLDFRQAVFLDTETTSLESGAGVHLFMIGIGYFKEDAFVVQQYFMRDPSEEIAMLHGLSDQLARFDLAVSFFGKNFDLPRMTDRYAINQLPMPFPDIHIDLCHTGRRIWNKRFANCQLQTLERGVLQFARTRDLPGAECPRAYFDYQRGFPSRVAEIFEHNRLDVISMAALTWKIHREMTDPQHPQVRANVARVYAETDDPATAITLYLLAKEALWPPKGRKQTAAAVDLMTRLSMLYRRAGDWNQATELWQEMVDRNLGDAFPHERLAMYYEHQEKTSDLAHEHACAALAYARNGGPGSAVAALEQRIARLEKKRETKTVSHD